MVYFQGGGSIRFAVGFVAGLLLRETAQRQIKKPPRSPLVPARRDQKDGEMIFVRQLEAEDFDKGFMELLAQLTSAGNVTREQWQERFASARHGPEFVFVVEEKGRLLASGTLVLERKFARGCGLCGHIEDIVVDAQCRGRGMGLVIVTALTRVAERMGCYKVILDFENQPVSPEKRVQAQGGADGAVLPGLSERECHETRSFINTTTVLRRRERLRDGARAGDGPRLRLDGSSTTSFRGPACTWCGTRTDPRAGARGTAGILVTSRPSR